jgi:glycosyltransferase involved in cell wall biosynthesis
MPRLAVLHYALGRFGGAAKIAILQAIYLKRSGFEVELFYGGPILRDWHKRASSELPFNSLPLGLPKSRREAQQIIATLKRLRKFDLILVSYGICPFFAFYLSGLFGHKVVWYSGEPLRALWEDYVSGQSYGEQKVTVRPTSKTIYGASYSSIFLSGILYDASIHVLRLLDVITAKHYRKIIANSEFTREIMYRLYRLDEVSVVHPGVDLTQYEAIETTGWKADNSILAVGALIPMKNHVTLLKAFKDMQTRSKNQVKLVIVGDGPLRDELTATINSLNISNVELKSSATEKELANLYADCEFVVHIALYEPFGLVPLEAAVFSKPAIVSQVGGPKEFVIDGKTGILVDPCNPKAVSNALIDLSRNKDKTCKMGSEAKKRVMEKFNMEKSSKELGIILRSILPESHV